MRSKSLIVIANILALMAGCVIAQQPRHQGVNPAPAATALTAAGGYLNAASLNLYRLLPPPPEAGSREERAELDELLRIQAARTPAQARRAAEDAKISIYRFADALGSPEAFNKDRLPLTTELFRRIEKDEALFINPAKEAFARPRPFVAEPQLTPVVMKPSSFSYPSGHSTWAIACAIVLSDMLPEKRREIFTRADEFARNREVAGVHYPSDVAGGHLAGTAFAQDLYTAPQFVADEVAATAELRQALGLPPLPRHQLYRH